MPLQRTILRKINPREQQHNLYHARYPQFIRTLLQKRMFERQEDFEFSLKHLLPYHHLDGIEQAGALIVKAIKAKQKILLVGDYDVDGAVSIALGMHLFNDFNYPYIDYLVPHRQIDGYGLTPHLVEKAHEDYAPSLIITVDNGISSLEGVKVATQLGIQVIITDHHLPGETLPEASAIVNPNKKKDSFPSKHLAGVGVFFYLLLQVRALLINEDYFKGTAPNLAKYLDLVAVGTVADLVPLDSNNRILVQQGLLRMRQNETLPGIKALVETSGRALERLTTQDISFGLAPLLNAAGRLDDMTIGIECLLAKDKKTADHYARSLYDLNQARREIEGEIREKAEIILSELHIDQATLPSVITLFHQSWHEGVTGIVASRLKSDYYRPTFVFAKSEEGLLKGSGRSIKGLHLRDVLAAIDSRYPALIERFGGHAMAAGLTLQEEYYSDFCQALEETINRQAPKGVFQEVLYSDGALPKEGATLPMAKLLQYGFPWGQGFPEPTFEDTFSVVNYRILKDKHLKFLLKNITTGETFDAIAFFQAERFTSPQDNRQDKQGKKIHALYNLGINYWRGAENLQLLIEYFEERP